VEDEAVAVAMVVEDRHMVVGDPVATDRHVEADIVVGTALEEALTTVRARIRIATALQEASGPVLGSNLRSSVFFTELQGPEFGRCNIFLRMTDDAAVTYTQSHMDRRVTRVFTCQALD
jgi:hypothetical protein